jgi:hypothetical protein
MTKDRIVDVLVGLAAVLWMAWTFATIQSTSGNVLVLLGAALTVGVLTILMIYGHRINYFRIGDWLLIEMDHPGEANDPDHDPQEQTGRGRHR